METLKCTTPKSSLANVLLGLALDPGVFRNVAPAVLGTGNLDAESFLDLVGGTQKPPRMLWVTVPPDRDDIIEECFLKLCILEILDIIIMVLIRIEHVTARVLVLQT